MKRLLLIFFLAIAAVAAEKTNAPIVKASPYQNLIIDAREAEAKGLMGKALESLDRAIQLDPNGVAAYFFKGQILALQRKNEEAIAVFSKVIELDPKASSAYEGRGEEEFKLGRIEKSIDDFNQYLRLEPRQAPYHWKRGIALYYAGKYDEGRKQFELHQTVNPQDVENGAWHFICAARSESIDKARQSMIPIAGDMRVPMREIYELYRGNATPDDVLKAAKKDNPSPAELDGRLFYAHLYLGLYFEAQGDKEQAYEHIKRAATDFISTDPYMGDVARVHFKRLLAPAAK
jgi:lipoprotein NlpI